MGCFLPASFFLRRNGKRCKSVVPIIMPVHIDESQFSINTKFCVYCLKEPEAGQATMRFYSNRRTMSANRDKEGFVPRGAWTFFVLLLVVGLVIWLAVYFVMVNRT